MGRIELGALVSGGRPPLEAGPPGEGSGRESDARAGWWHARYHMPRTGGGSGCRPCGGMSHPIGRDGLASSPFVGYVVWVGRDWPDPAETGARVMVHLQTNIAGVPVHVDFADLPAASQAFVIEYGLRQYIQDGAAVSKKDADGNARPDAEIAAEKADGVRARLENLAKGEFTRRNAAERLSPEEKERDAIVFAALSAAAKATNVTLPTKTGKNANPDKLRELMNRYYAKYRAEVDKEVARRMRENAKPVDLSGILD